MMKYISSGGDCASGPPYGFQHLLVELEGGTFRRTDTFTDVIWERWVTIGKHSPFWLRLPNGDYLENAFWDLFDSLGKPKI